MVVTPVFADSGKSDSDVSLTPVNLTFTRSDWNVQQSVTMAALVDNEYEFYNESHVVRFDISSVDGRYSTSSCVKSNVSLCVHDEDVMVNISRAELSIDEGSNKTYTVALLSQPSATVTVSLWDPMLTSLSVLGI